MIADLAVRPFVALQERHRRDGIGDRLRPVERADHLARLVLVLRRAAGRRQEIRRERQKAFERHAPRHVLDVRIEPAVLVHHDDRRQRPGGIGRPHQIAAHRLPFGARPGDRLGLHPRIVLRDDRRARLVGGEHRRDRRRGRRRAGQPLQLLHEIAAVERQMRVVVVELDHLLRDLWSDRWLRHVVHRRLLGFAMAVDLNAPTLAAPSGTKATVQSQLREISARSPCDEPHLNAGFKGGSAACR